MPERNPNRRTPLRALCATGDGQGGLSRPSMSMTCCERKTLLPVVFAFAISGLTVGQAQDPSSSSPAQTQPDVTQRVPVSAGLMTGLIIKKVQPLYPEKARKRHIQGIVTLG